MLVLYTPVVNPIVGELMATMVSTNEIARWINIYKGAIEWYTIMFTMPCLIWTLSSVWMTTFSVVQ